ncbi:divalent metal cation transporter, partial [Staphylococcus hominis]|uniref:divalent metal cation transporter n=2 Tax=Staphylococcus TaxID=1279 RepID=UPI0030BC4B1E
RKIEAIVGVLIFTVLAIFVFEVFVASPHVNEMLEGFLPSQSIITNHSILFIALGIVGATIMPHNLYLHSSIVQSRMYDRNSTES